MMEETLKINKCFFIVAINMFSYLTLVGQEVFYCDTTNAGSEIVISSCDYFFNFFKNETDSILKIDSYEYDSLLEAEMPTYKKESVIILAQKICSGCDSIKLVYFHNGVPFLQGNLLNGEAEGYFEWNFRGESMNAYFHKGKLNGKKTKFFKNDKKLIENYVDGILSGEMTVIDRYDKFLYFCLFDNGVKEGLEYGLHENGMLNFVNFYNAGILRDGIYDKYDGSGKVYLSLSVKNGKIVERIWHNE